MKWIFLICQKYIYFRDWNYCTTCAHNQCTIPMFYVWTRSDLTMLRAPINPVETGNNLAKV